MSRTKTPRTPEAQPTRLVIPPAVAVKLEKLARAELRSPSQQACFLIEAAYAATDGNNGIGPK